MAKRKQAGQVQKQVVQEQVVVEEQTSTPQEEPKAPATVVTVCEVEALKAANSAIKADANLTDKVNDLVREYTIRGVKISDLAKEFQQRMQAATMWPKATDGSRFLNTSEARDFPAGRVYNTLSTRKSRCVAEADGTAKLVDGKLVWTAPVPTEQGKRDPRQPEGPSAEESKSEHRKAVREEAATVKAAAEALGSITAEVWLIRRELEQLRALPMFRQLLMELDGRFDNIEAEVKDLMMTLELDPKGVEDAADKAKVANS